MCSLASWWNSSPLTKQSQVTWVRACECVCVFGGPQNLKVLSLWKAVCALANLDEGQAVW